MAANSGPVPDAIADRPCSGQFVVWILPEAHRRLALEGAEHGVSLNRLVPSRLVADRACSVASRICRQEIADGRRAKSTRVAPRSLLLTTWEAADSFGVSRITSVTRSEDGPIASEKPSRHRRDSRAGSECQPGRPIGAPQPQTAAYCWPVQRRVARSATRRSDPARPPTWSRLIHDALRLDRSALDVAPALRCGLGIAIPLVAGDLAGHVLVGVEAAIGALTAGTASLQGTYRSRAGTMSLAAGAFALSAFVGATLGHLLGPDIAVTAAWGVVAGFLVLFGQAPSVVGLQAVVGLVVFSQFTLEPRAAALTALWALAGGALQVALVALTWPLQRFPVERRASSTAYGLLAAHLRALPGEPSALLDPAALDELRAALRETQPFGDQAAAAAFLALADEADRIRLEAAGIARVRARLGPGLSDELDVALGAAASLLAAVATALRDGRSAAVASAAREGFRRAVASLRHRADAGSDADADAGSGAGSGTTGTAGSLERALLVEAAAGVTALAGQLRSVLQLTAVAAGDQPAPDRPAAGPVAPHRHRSVLRPAARARRTELVRANLTRSSEAFRHALRVGVTLGVAVAVAHLFPLGHGYWLPMTVMIVLKPDFAATLGRGVARSIGTLLGAGAVTLLLAAVRPTPAALVVLTVVLYAASIAVLRASYVLYSVGIASLVVVLLAFLGSPAPALAADRSFYTVLGAALALAAYAIWPTWERARVADRLAELVEVDGHYGAALLHAWSDPAGADLVALHRLRLAARLARSNAEASVDRWLHEPPGRSRATPAPLAADQALGILAAVRRYVWGALALHSRLPATGTARPGLDHVGGELDRLGDELDGALAALAAALRTGTAPASFPALRATQVALAARLIAAPSSEPAGGPAGGPAGDGALLASETDLMVNAVDTCAHLLGVGTEPAAEHAGLRRAR